MDAELAQRMEALDVTTTDFISSLRNPGGPVDGSIIRKFASESYRKCKEENLSRQVIIDPVKYALNEVEKGVLDSQPWKYCKFVNPMTEEELKQSDGKMVRFRGMIQEAHDPVMYKSDGNVVSQDGSSVMDCFIFRDECDDGLTLDPRESIDYRQFRDLELFHAISVPGESKWMKKCTYDLDESKTFMMGKKYDNCNGEAHRNATFAFPIPEMYDDEMLKACIIKVYTVPSGLRLNQVCDFYGILSLYSESDELPSHNDDFEKANDEDAERMVRDPNPLLVPRIHCVTAIPVSSEKVCDVIPRVQVPQDCTGTLEKIILDTFMGDEIVMKYVLCNLVSSVETRLFGSSPVGCFPLLISDISTNMLGNVFSEVVEFITPKSYFIKNLRGVAETLHFYPVKDFRTNKLNGGLLQLTDGTHLIVQDLTRPNDIQNLGGGPTSLAKVNFQCLEKLIEWQTITYDYKYNQLEMFHDIPVVILSRSRNPLDTQWLTVVPWCQQIHDNVAHEEVIIPKMMTFLKTSDVVNRIRFCIQEAKLKRCPPTSDSVNDLITGDFVKSRQNNDTSRHMTEEDFHRCLTMTKCFAKLYSDGEITYDTWKLVLSLESERKRRLAEIPCMN